MKKLLCLMLALLMCATALMACAEEKPEEQPDQPSQDGGDTPDEPIKEDPWLDDLEDRKMNGLEIVFAYFNKNGVKDGCSVDAEEPNGDLINDAMYARNTAVEERFDVVLTGNEVSTAGGIATAVTPVLTSGATDYDVLVGYQYYDIGLAATGLMYCRQSAQHRK